LCLWLAGCPRGVTDVVNPSSFFCSLRQPAILPGLENNPSLFVFRFPIQQNTQASSLPSRPLNSSLNHPHEHFFYSFFFPAFFFWFGRETPILLQLLLYRLKPIQTKSLFLTAR
jgi:hypothetical protein